MTGAAARKPQQQATRTKRLRVWECAINGDGGVGGGSAKGERQEAAWQLSLAGAAEDGGTNDGAALDVERYVEWKIDALSGQHRPWLFRHGTDWSC